MTCPRCNQDAPTVLRGARVTCAACGAPRPLTTAPEAINLAGRPAKVGGGIASALGWIALTIGLSIAFVLGVIAKLLFVTATGLWIGGTIAFITMLVALPLLFGGRRLHKAGDERARAARNRAMFDLASHHRGVVTARDAARMLATTEEEADGMLTALAKQSDGRVTVEVDDAGVISYVFHDLVPAAPATRVRIEDQPWQAPQAGELREPAEDRGYRGQAPPIVRERARVAPSAAPRVVDAELVEEEEQAVEPRARQVSR